MPRSYLRPCLLLLLGEGSSHGYELLEQVRGLGVRAAEPGGLYRALRAMEREGLVQSWWERSQSGPARRTYALTCSGQDSLHCAADTLTETRQLLDNVLDRYLAVEVRTERRHRHEDRARRQGRSRKDHHLGHPGAIARS